MEENIPFPLLAGQWIATTINGVKKYIQISGQARYFDIPYSYEIGPSLQIAYQSITLGTGSGALSAFRTNANGLKEWVTWIDNKYLTVSWNINSTDMNYLSNTPEAQTALQTPYGSINFPLFIYNNASGNVTFTLTNTSLTKTIRGTMHIMLYDYSTLPPVSTVPDQFTDINYKGE